MKQCDRGIGGLRSGGLSPFARPFPIGSSSLSFVASESDPEDSFWGDFTFDFSFLTSDDQKSGPDDADSLSNLSHHADVTTLPPKAEGPELCGFGGYALGAKGDLANAESYSKLSRFIESDLKCVDSQPQILDSASVISANHCDSNATMGEAWPQHYNPSSVLGNTSTNPEINIGRVADNNSGNDETKGQLPYAKDKAACSDRVLVSQDINESKSSLLFSKLTELQIKCSKSAGHDQRNLYSSNTMVFSEKSSIPLDQDETEVDSPCWRGTQSASGTKSLNFRRSGNDLKGLYGLNPLAPQFIPSNAKTNLDTNGKEFEENSFSSLKKSMSSTFPSSLGEFSITDLPEVGMKEDSDPNGGIGALTHDADESLGLVSHNSISMSILDDNEFQTPTKLDPLAPVFFPTGAKLSAVVHEKHGGADHMIAFEKVEHLTSSLSSPDIMFHNDIKADAFSADLNHSFSSGYSDNVLEARTTYSFNPQLESEVGISENSKLFSFSNNSHGLQRLNPLAPQFSPADAKPKFYGCEKKQAANDLSPEGHVGCSPSSPSPKMNVKKLLTTMHGLSELLTHVHGSESLDSPNEQELDLINYTVQNLNLYIKNRVQGHAGNYSSVLHSSYDSKLLPNMRKLSIRDHQLPRAENMTANYDIRKEKYPMVLGEMGADSHMNDNGVNRENGFGQVVAVSDSQWNHQKKEQFNPQVFFYRSLWLKAEADRSLMEYETLLSKTKS